MTESDNQFDLHVNEDIFWALNLAVSQGSVSEIVSPFKSSGPFQKADGWGVNKAQEAWMESDDKIKIMTLAL